MVGSECDEGNCCGTDHCVHLRKVGVSLSYTTELNQNIRLTDFVDQVVPVLFMEMRRQIAVVADVVQVVVVNVDWPFSSNSTTRAEMSAGLGVRVRMIMASTGPRTHVLGMVVGDSDDGDISISVWVGKSNDWVVSVSRRTAVSGLYWKPCWVIL